MHFDLIKSMSKDVHGTDTGKKTACGINLLKPENVGRFTTIGTMNDVSQLTCEKCKTVIAKKMIREANKEMAAQLKEEEKMLKRERAASKHHGGDMPVPSSPAPSRSSSRDDEPYVPPSMRKAAQAAERTKPIETPTPAPSVSAPKPAAAPAAKDDVLSQFAIPTVPSSLPGRAPAAPAPQPAADPLAQFAIPTVPTSLPHRQVRLFRPCIPHRSPWTMCLHSLHCRMSRPRCRV